MSRDLSSPRPKSAHSVDDLQPGAKAPVAGPSLWVPVLDRSPGSIGGAVESDRGSDVKSTTTTTGSASSTRPLLKNKRHSSSRSVAGVSDVSDLPSHPESSPDPNDGDGDNDDQYPEGGFRAWLVVFGSWLALFASLGLMNVMATFDTYLSARHLVDHEPGSVGLMVSLYTVLSFMLGIYVGPIFDKYGPRWPIMGGSVCLFAALIVVSISTNYWHLLVAFAVFSGLGSALLFTPSIAVIGHYFKARRGLATGVATTAGSVSAVVFPYIVQELFVKVGWPWTMRALALICLAVAVGANFLIRARLPPAKHAKVSPSVHVFATKGFGLTLGAVFLLQFASFIPLAFLSAYVLAKGFSQEFSFDVVTVLNASSAFGRVAGGWLGDLIGVYNANVAFAVVSAIACFAVWLPVEEGRAGMVGFAVLFGFTNGSGVSLVPVTVGRLCGTREYGRFYGTVYTVVSLGVLLAIPIAGKLVLGNRGSYDGLIILTGVAYLASAVVFMVAKMSVVGWRARPWVVF
ncbi:major facilitator superfamily domain-containing protein [Apiosordaria backusii]|uniref:Major facilitator superfamily domain-containing protein n=1 Tax=Apiosordaria backusii TaxID=314023 RepID=A0AA40AXR2_9PEZI|nr:major facilitator superfamily domain-containing protein [Apiosordaria backusii]